MLASFEQVAVSASSSLLKIGCNDLCYKSIVKMNEINVLHGKCAAEVAKNKSQATISNISTCIKRSDYQNFLVLKW